MADYELTFILAMAGGGLVVFTCLVISQQANNKLALILAVVGLSVFTFVIISQIDRLKAERWSLWDVIIVAAILFIVIWITPDIMKVVRQRRGLNDK